MRPRTILATGVLAIALIVPRSTLAADTYGAGVSLNETTPITRVIEKPADFEGKTVKVEGVVTAVCTMMGCWMALAPDGAADAARTMMIKVDDGVIVFPVTAKGRRAVAQGVVERVGGDAESREAAAEHAKHAGAANTNTGHGAAAHGDAAHAGTAHGDAAHGQSATAWQIKATGAVVY